MGLTTGAGRTRETLPTMAALGELLGTVTCTSALILAVAPPLVRWEPISAENVHVLLTAAMATIGAAAAILGTVTARLIGDRRLAWLAAAVASYCLVVLPVTILRPTSVPDGAVGQATWLAGQVFVVGLLVVALRPPALLGAGTAWAAVAASALCAQAASSLAVSLATPRQSVLVPAVLTAVVVAGWAVVGFALLLAGYRDRDVALAGVALGLTLLAGVHLYRTASGPAAHGVDLRFDQLRLLGLIVVFAGMLRLARHALGEVRTERVAHDEDMRLAAVHMRRAADQAAERDHELRNGLAGLSGITTLLSSTASTDEREGLRSTMLSELARLAEMIDGTGAVPAGGRYDVVVELRHQVQIHRAAGTRISLQLESGELYAVGSPVVVAQVMANLLGNCARHAPGASVCVEAVGRGARIEITVSDDGPGIPAGQERAVLERGVRHPQTGGSGLGLYLSRQLLSGEGGALRIQPGGAGCTVVVELPAASANPVLGLPAPRSGERTSR
jgi:two-component system, OmpR family, sensor kinase